MQSVLAFLRMGEESDPPVAVVSNFTPEVRKNYRIGLPHPGRWREALNTDAALYGGSNVGNLGAVEAELAAAARIDRVGRADPAAAGDSVPCLRGDVNPRSAKRAKRARICTGSV